MNTQLESYLEYLRGLHYAPDTLRTRRHCLTKFFGHLRLIGVAGLREVNPQMIEGHRLELMRHYGLGFVRHQMGSLRHFLAWLKSTDASQVNPALDVPPPKEKRSWPKRKTTETGQKPDGRFKKPVDLPGGIRVQLETYLESLRVRHYSADTLDCRKHGLTQFFEHLKTNGVADLRDVARQTIADYRLALMRRYCVGSVRSQMGSLRHFFAWLESTDAILLNPTLNVPLPKEERPLPRRILKPSEVRKIMASPDETPKGLRDRAILELFYSSGIRREEMARLTVADVDIKNGFVRVHGKGHKERIVPIGQTACEALARYLKEARALWLKVRLNPGWTDALWLSPIQPHAPIHKAIFDAILQRHAVRAIGRRVSPHVWRHSFATHLVANGANVVYVQRLLGHKSLKTTDIYTRVVTPDLKRMVKRAHPRAGKTAAPTAAVSPEDAAKMAGGLRFNHLIQPKP
jgi:site-specific recombinase XerD